MQRKQFNSILIPAIGLSLLGLSCATQAAVITASSTWTLGGANGAGSPDIDGPATSGFVDVLDSDDNGAGDSVFYHTYGNTTGTFGSRVSGAGNFDISSEFNFIESYQNTAATAQAASFGFTIIPGKIDIDFFGTMLAGNFLNAAYEIDIRLNGASIWDSAAAINRTLSGTNFSQSGSDIGGTYSATSERYSWSSFSETLDLGLMAAGEIFTIEYDLRTTASGSFAGLDCSTGGGGNEEGDEPAFADEEGEGGREGDDEGSGSSASCGSAIGQSGDPFNQNFGNSTTVTGASAVPEPTTLFLLGLGFAGLFVSRKKQA